MRGWRRRTAPSLLCIVGFLAALTLVSAGPAAGQGEGQRAGLLVVHGDGRVVTRCVAFSESQISGLALLERAGLAVVSASGPMGSTICAVNGEGCAASDCWCECRGEPCLYWTYFQGASEGGWTYGGLGAALRQVGDGDVDAWVWGNGRTLPPPVGFEAICGAEVMESSPSPTLAPEASPTPRPTDGVTPSPEDARETAPAPTAGPTFTPRATPSPTQSPTEMEAPSPEVEVEATAVPEAPSFLSPTADDDCDIGEICEVEGPTTEPSVLPESVDDETPEGGSSEGWLGYGTLGIIGGGLVVWLVLQTRRRRGM